MAALSNVKVSVSARPRAEDYDYDLDAVLNSVVGIRSIIPADAFTAETLGTERTGNGIVIRDNIVLTIGYLITEADTVWLHLNDGRAVQGYALGYDQETGFGLVQALARLDLTPAEIGRSGEASVGDPVVIGGAGGRAYSTAARIVGRQQFAGYWEYAIDEAIFTAPAHPHWGGTALIGPKGDLIGVGSLQLERASQEGDGEYLNMIVPIDLLAPIMDDLLTLGRPNRPPRAWLGLYGTEVEDRIVIVGVAKDGPAQRAKLRTGDMVLAVDGKEVSDLADCYRRVWAMGPAGAQVPLTIYRDGRTFEVTVASADRNRYLKAPRLH
ncbi:MAG TPA: S1C family serine protease [Pseudorhodoplanes sp.]|jgi:S1-C subfamily serine protease|nr:S1C family serine protease [Pseudorhodoplanes sp.]